MARIRILELPIEHVGEVSRTPFALVIDQVDTERVVGTHEGTPIVTMSELTQSEADQIAERLGAVGAILTACTLDIA